ncbi:MAG: nucleotidyltransferase family protein [Luteibaculaceae bacterium]
MTVRLIVFEESLGMQKILKDNLTSLNDLCVKYNVKSLHAFGFVCTDNFNENSDIDLLISLKPMESADYADTYFELADNFEDIFKRPVDLVTDKSLGNPYFIESLNKTKTILYES